MHFNRSLHLAIIHLKSQKTSRILEHPAASRRNSTFPRTRASVWLSRTHSTLVSHPHVACRGWVAIHRSCYPLWRYGDNKLPGWKREIGQGPRDLSLSHRMLTWKSCRYYGWFTYDSASSIVFRDVKIDVCVTYRSQRSHRQQPLAFCREVVSEPTPTYGYLINTNDADEQFQILTGLPGFDSRQRCNRPLCLEVTWRKCEADRS